MKMKKHLVQILAATLLVSSASYAGNPDRAGGAGATQLLLNPYGRSAGLSNSNTASVRGIESFYLNIAGLAYSKKTEIQFSQMLYLVGTDMKINNLGFSQSLGENGTGGTIGLGITFWDMGNITNSTIEQPDGTLGTYSPQIMNFGMAYSKKFSNSISGGLLLRFVSEGIASVKAQGIALDAGVQYQTTLDPRKKIKKEDFRFGISIRNLGPDMAYEGDGLALRVIITGTGADRKLKVGSQVFNTPALANIGVSYDMRLDKGEETYDHKLTVSGNFNYNAFASDIIALGAEYSLKETFMLRAGYAHQNDNFNSTDYRSPQYGVNVGLGFQMPISNSGTSFSLDYSYAPTVIFSGIHTLGLKLSLGN